MSAPFRMTEGMAAARGSRRRAQRGVTLIETLLSIAIMGMMSVGVAYAINERSLDLRAETAASQMRVVRDAADSLMHDHYLTLFKPVAVGTAPIRITTAQLAGTAPIVVGGRSVTVSYLPPAMLNADAYGNRYEVWVTRDAAGAQAMVVTIGSATGPAGDVTNLKRLSSAAVLTGGTGAFVNNTGDAAINAIYPADTFIGAYGSYQRPVAAFQPAGAVASGEKVFLGNLIRYSESKSVSDFLSRVDVPGAPGANEMQTTVHMNWNALSLGPAESVNDQGAITNENYLVYQYDGNTLSSTDDTMVVGRLKDPGDASVACRFLFGSVNPISPSGAVAPSSPTLNATRTSDPSDTSPVPKQQTLFADCNAGQVLVGGLADANGNGVPDLAKSEGGRTENFVVAGTTRMNPAAGSDTALSVGQGRVQIGDGAGSQTGLTVTGQGAVRFEQAGPVQVANGGDLQITSSGNMTVGSETKAVTFGNTGDTAFSNAAGTVYLNNNGDIAATNRSKNVQFSNSGYFHVNSGGDFAVGAPTTAVTFNNTGGFAVAGNVKDVGFTNSGYVGFNNSGQWFIGSNVNGATINNTGDLTVGGSVANANFNNAGGFYVNSAGTKRINCNLQVGTPGRTSDCLDVGGGIWAAGSIASAGDMSASNATFSGRMTAHEIWYDSDRNLKTNIRPVENALERLLKVQGVDYDWIASGKHDTGVIAQEVLKPFPNLVQVGDDGVMRVKYSNMIGPVIEAIRELKSENDSLRTALGAAAPPARAESAAAPEPAGPAREAR